MVLTQSCILFPSHMKHQQRSTTEKDLDSVNRALLLVAQELEGDESKSEGGEKKRQALVQFGSMGHAVQLQVI